jgi:tRNA-Thr(GGU) m(6)t(6)A37 methyltransferase TsaA
LNGLTIPTARLILSPLRAGDAQALFDYRSDPDVSRYQSFDPASADDALAFIEAASGADLGGWTSLGIRFAATGDLVGDVGFHMSPDAPGSAQVGVTLAPGHQGRGLAAEALLALLGHLFTSLAVHRVFASVDPRNASSMALMRRVGMRQEAHLRESLPFKGEWADDVIFAMLDSEWERAVATVGMDPGGAGVFRMEPIGFVRGGRTAVRDDFWGGAEARIELMDAIPSEALDGIEGFSHAEIVFVFDRVDPARIVTGARHPRNNPGWPLVGIFAQRGKNRPNRIGCSIVRVLRRDGRTLFVSGLDAVDGTPVLDIKPVLKEYLPSDPVEQPEWSHEVMREYWAAGK